MKILFLSIGTFLSATLYSQTISLVSPADANFLNVRDYCQSANGKEIFVTIQSVQEHIAQIICIKNNNWKKANLLAFNDAFNYLEPFLSADGKRLFFASNRPNEINDTTAGDFNIWYVERVNENNAWSDPVFLSDSVNTEEDEFFPSVAANGNIYFTKDSKNGLGKDDIYVSYWLGNGYSKPKLLDQNINSEGYEFNAFVSADEKFIIYTKYNAAEGFGSGDLYVAKKDNDGNWLPVTNLGEEINSSAMEYCPFYNAKEKTLYFTSRRNNLKPKKFSSLQELQENLLQGENGLSRIYKVKIDIE
jgi:hypothetical protein